jgi:hypothetical protein
LYLPRNNSPFCTFQRTIPRFVPSKEQSPILPNKKNVNSRDSSSQKLTLYLLVSTRVSDLFCEYYDIFITHGFYFFTYLI